MSNEHYYALGQFENHIVLVQFDYSALARPRCPNSELLKIIHLVQDKYNLGSLRGWDFDRSSNNPYPGITGSGSIWEYFRKTNQVLFEHKAINYSFDINKILKSPNVFVVDLNGNLVNQNIIKNSLIGFIEPVKFGVELAAAKTASDQMFEVVCKLLNNKLDCDPEYLNLYKDIILGMLPLLMHSCASLHDSPISPHIKEISKILMTEEARKHSFALIEFIADLFNVIGNDMQADNLSAGEYSNTENQKIENITLYEQRLYS